MQLKNASLLAVAAACLSPAVRAQNQPAAPAGPSVTVDMREPSAVQLVRSVSLPGIDGDFDSLAVDLKHDRLFVAAEEHHTIEVFKASTGEHLRSVGGVKTPHALAVFPRGTSSSSPTAGTPRRWSCPPTTSTASTACR